MVPEGNFWYHHLAIGNNQVLDVLRYLIFCLAIVFECCHGCFFLCSLLLLLLFVCLLIRLIIIMHGLLRIYPHMMLLSRVYNSCASIAMLCLSVCPNSRQTGFP